MDKLRALEYFMVSAEERSFSRAARRLDVSVPAVAKLIRALERELGAALFERSAQGLTLTTGGERYLEACQPLIAQLTAAEEILGEASVRPRGTLVIGAHPELVMLPWLSRFHARYPDIYVDVRPVTRRTLHETPADAYLVHGWPEQPDMVLRRIAQPRLLTCAAPEYWAANGIPRQPQDIEQHVCLLYCNDEGTVNDLWQYDRDGKTVAVTARGWLVSNHRQLSLNAALSGEGVIRVSDLMAGEHLRSGRLVPALVDWEMRDAPPYNLLYAANQRRNQRVRLFIDFVVDAFREMEAGFGYGGLRQKFAERPYWLGLHARRASSAARSRN